MKFSSLFVTYCHDVNKLIDCNPVFRSSGSVCYKSQVSQYLAILALPWVETAPLKSVVNLVESAISCFADVFHQRQESPATCLKSVSMA